MAEQALKAGWRWVKFGDVVKLNKERCKNPIAEGIERYVGLEHITPEDLRVRQWGLVAEGTTFTNYFQPGQVLFGKRRAYQRKVAVAEFAGVCSSDIYVFEPKNEQLHPELLPFICQTDGFFNHAVRTSAGSLSPRTNWKQLAKYEFALPPLTEQRRYARLLQVNESLRENLHSAIRDLARLRTSIIEDAIGKIDRVVRFDDILLEASYGCSKRANSDGIGMPILRIPNVLRGEIDFSDLKWINLSQQDIERYSVHNGDILIVRTNGNPKYVGRCVVVHEHSEPMLYASYLIRLRVNKKIANADFIATVLNSPTLRRHIRASVRSSAGNYNLNTQGIRRQKIPLPQLAEQQKIIEYMSKLRSSQQSLNSRMTQNYNFKKHILAVMER